MLKEKEDIRAWLREHILYFNNNDWAIDDDGNTEYTSLEIIYFKNMDGVKELPFNFVKSNSAMSLNAKDLENLNNFPKLINGFFKIENTKIKNLINFPTKINGYIFIINNNYLESLEGLIIDDKYMYENQPEQKKLLLCFDDEKNNLIDKKWYNIYNNNSENKSLLSIKFKLIDKFIEQHSISLFNKEIVLEDYLNQYEIDLDFN